MCVTLLTTLDKAQVTLLLVGWSNHQVEREETHRKELKGFQAGLLTMVGDPAREGLLRTLAERISWRGTDLKGASVQGMESSC